MKTGEELRLSHRWMLRVLSSQQSRRHKYPGTTWIDVKIDVMHHQVNCDRSKRGLPDLSRDVVARAKSMAAGHSDYASKVALYCAELTLGIARWV